MSNYDQLSHEALSIPYLAKNLNDGNLVLFLGAGTSSGFGLPDWVTLINTLGEKHNIGPFDENSSAPDLQTAADEIIHELKGNTEQLIRDLEAALYPNLENISNTSVFDNHLLVAISALLMGSKRGRVTRVITLNYDSMLEWFLSLFGFVVKTIHKLPEMEGSEDVRIYHPHGFVPIPDKGMEASDFIILGMDSVYKRLGKMGDPWFEMTRHILNTGLCLFIGMSPRTLSDSALGPLFISCGENCAPTRPLGLWVLSKAPEPSIVKQYQRNNIVPVIVDGHKAIPEFLLKICETAGNSLLNK